MTKKILALLALILCMYTGIYAQKEIWGSVYGNASVIDRYGYIYRTDSLGNNLVIMHRFDSIHGKNPGELTVGSNGKLYGCAQRGGSGQYLVPNGSPGQQTYGGVLFEYDPILDSLRVLHYFDIANTAFPYDNPTPYRLLEYSPGVFYGTLNYLGRVIFKYTLATNTISVVTTVPSFIGGPMGSNTANYVNGALAKASNGNIYAASTANSACPIGSPDAGTLLRLIPSTNALSAVYLNPCSITSGTNYSCPGLEYAGKLYGVARGGDYGAGTSYLYPGYGVVYEFNPATNAYAKKADFTGGANGKNPTPVMLQAANGKFYGTADGGTPYVNMLSQSYPNGSGIIFEFNPTTNALTTVHEFRTDNQVSDEGEYGRFSLKSTNGKLYGISTTGIYAYNPVTGNIELGARLPYSIQQNLVEICRKPSYAYNATTQYTVCAGAHFIYDLQSNNTVTATWLHNGFPDPTQTSPVLQFNAITAANAGTWVCTLSNSCGSITPPAITITVNAAGSGTITSTITPTGPVMICPGSSTTLSGNNGGTWNTGATTPTITVNMPGEYRVTNVNACGNTYSNIVIVDTIPSPPKPVATLGYFNGCPGGTVTISGNDNGGVWNTGATTPTITVTAAPNVPYYITNTHTCGIDVSNSVQLYPSAFLSTTGTPTISTIGSPTFCAGGSVTLVANTSVNSNAFWVWNKYSTNWVSQGSSSAIQPITTTESGIYVLSMSLSQCGILRTDTIYVTKETYPQTPVITALGNTTICANDSVTLQHNLSAGGVWSNGQTGQQITVNQPGTYSVTNANSCGSETSNTIYVQVLPIPTVSFTEPTTEFCTAGNNHLLTGGTPAGGTYSGAGVNAGQYFAPWIAGLGYHTLTYTYSNGTCSASATQQVQVIEPQPAVLLSNQANNAFCEGSSLLLFQTQYQTVNWSTGDVGVVLFVTQPGTYSYTATNACGTITSNSIVATTKPVSPTTYNPQTICAGQTYTINGHTYTTAGTYTDAFANVYGCDSSVITQLTVTTAPSSVNPQTICAGALYTINGHAYSTAGTYTDTLQGIHGCDSLVITQLTVTPASGSNNPQTVCAGTTYSFNGHIYSTSGIYADTLQAVNGCDSIVVTQLTVTSAPNSNNPQTICAGETYTFNGHAYSTTGTYVDTFQASGGCDSTVTTQLTVLPAASSSNPQSICLGESYTINGHTYSTTGTYTDVFQAINGCDSTVTTQLTVQALDISVTQNGTALAATQTAATYQWINCQTQMPISGATAQTYTANLNGSYAVVLHANGCSDTSACYTVNTVSIKEWDTQPICSLYPNPTSDAVWIKTNATINRVSVYNALGQCVYVVQNSNKLDVVTLAPGTYFVTVETDEIVWRGKFVKN